MLYNYADDNTLAYFSKTMPDLVDTLEKETGVALSWLKQNEMIANPEKFHAILLWKDQTSTSGEQTNIDGEIINSEETVKLLGVTLDYQLDIDPHISYICKKARTQLNALQRLKLLISFKEKKVFFHISSTVPWSGIFHLLNLFRTLKSYMNVRWDFSITITPVHIMICFWSQIDAWCLFLAKEPFALKFSRPLTN